MTRAAARKKRTQTRRDNTTLVIALVIVGVVVAALLILLNMGLDTRGTTPVVNTTGRTWGKAEAPVTIDMWSDFQ